MGKNCHCGKSYYAISQKERGGQQAQLGGKCYQIPRGKAQDEGTWYGKICFENKINI